MSYNILSIDGGGLRGIIALAVLENLDHACPGWRDRINMFAGTSTGGLIALAMARGMAPREIMDVYLNRAEFIFDRSLWHGLKSLGEVIGAKYDGRHRETVCHDVLKDSRLKDYLSPDGTKGHVVVTSFNLDAKLDADPAKRRWSAKIFHNLPTKDASDDGGEIAYRVAMRTSAAPTYFPSYDGFADGGVFANNPGMCALAQTQDFRLLNPIPLGDVRMLSLGTGFAPNHIDGEENWGLAEWAPKLVDLLMDGVNEVADFQVKQIIGKSRYARLTAALGRDIALDDPSAAGLLQRIGSSIDVAAAVALVSKW